MGSLLKLVAQLAPNARSSAAMRRIRVVLFVVSVGAHAAAVYYITHLVLQLQKHQQQARRNGGRPRSLSPPRQSEVSDAQMQALVDRLQQHHGSPEEEGTDDSEQTCPQRTENGVSQLEEQFQKFVNERDSLRAQMERLDGERTALEQSKQQMRDTLAQHVSDAASLTRQNEDLREETRQEKEANALLNKENEVLRNEVGRLTELVDQMKKTQEAFRANRMLAMPSAFNRTNSAKKLSILSSPPPQLDTVS